MDDERLKTALMDSKNRVHSMAALHETLYQSENLSTIDMNSYLSKLTNVISRNYSIKSKINLKTDAKNIFIAAKQVSPIGLIMNELINYKFIQIRIS